MEIKWFGIKNMCCLFSCKNFFPKNSFKILAIKPKSLGKSSDTYIFYI